MPIFVVERTFDPAWTGAGGPCHVTSEVRVLRSLRSRDGLRGVSVYEAPSLTAVRAHQEARALPYDHLWCAANTAHEALPERPVEYALVVAQRTLERPATSADLQRWSEQSAGCSGLYRVIHLETWLAQDLPRLVCLHYAPDAESVRASNSMSRIPLERAWPAEPFGEVVPSP